MQYITPWSLSLSRNIEPNASCCNTSWIFIKTPPVSQPIEHGKSIEYKMQWGVLTRCGVMLIKRKNSEFKTRDVVHDIGRIFKGSLEKIQDLVPEFGLAPGRFEGTVLLCRITCRRKQWKLYSASVQCWLLHEVKFLLIDLESKTQASKDLNLYNLITHKAKLTTIFFYTVINNRAYRIKFKPKAIGN